MITVLGKRVGEELAKLTEELLENGKTPEDPEVHMRRRAWRRQSPTMGRQNVAQVPEPNPASLTANLDPLMEPSSPASK